MKLLGRPPAWLAMSLAAAVLVSMLVFFYARTQRNDALNYVEHVAMLRHLKQLDAQWELDVLKSKIGLNAHYDPLAGSLVEMIALLNGIESDLGAEQHGQVAGVAEGVAALRRAIDEKAALVERFKSNNAVLRNSLAFLPTAEQDVRQSLGRLGVHESAAAERMSENVNKLLLASMLYSQSASDEHAADIQSGLRELDTDKLLLRPETMDRLDIFGAHVRTVLREQRGVNELLGLISAVPTAARVEEIQNVLSAEQQRVADLSRQYLGYLLVFSALLLGLFLYAAARLIRSHAVINRVNKKLHSANETLEQRVEERTQELRQVQSDLLATARQAGMAEIATNVLHNVGNVLNSVNVSAGLVGASVRSSKILGLTRAVQMLNEHADDLASFMTLDTKGKMLPGYLTQLSQVLLAEQQSILNELTSMTKSVDHIKEIIATQQAYAGTASLMEPARIEELVEDALRMNAGALARQQVTVEKEFAPVPVLPLDKGRILQILVNLIGNAKQAMEVATDRTHRLTLSVGMVRGHTLRVAVADTGVGIPPENLVRVFAHGFTTKEDGHGFGLHSAAVAAREMGGALTAHSNGPGTGAVFVLELPAGAAQKTEETT